MHLSDDETADHSRSGALSVMREVARGSDMTGEHPVSRCFSDDDYESIISLAWRYQFDDDRAAFRQGLLDLETYLEPRILAVEAKENE